MFVRGDVVARISYLMRRKGRYYVQARLAPHVAMIAGRTSRSDMPARYGAKQRLTTRDLKQIIGASSPVIDQMTELLMGAKERADAGELQVLKPWLLVQNWSAYYKQKLT